MLTMVEKVCYHAEAPRLSTDLEPGELSSLPGISQASMAYTYEPDSPVNPGQWLSTILTPVTPVTEDSTSQQIRELEAKLALEVALHKRTSEALASVTEQWDKCVGQASGSSICSTP